MIPWKCFCGVDPGFTGAISFIFIDSSKTVQDVLIIPMPILKTIECGELKTKVNYKDIDDIFKEYKDQIITATVESQQVMPTHVYGRDQNGKSIIVENIPAKASNMFKLAEQYGCLRMSLVSNGITYNLVHPKVWQGKIFPMVRSYGTKKTSIERAKELYPTANLIPDRARTERHGHSDSLLLAHYGKLLHESNNSMVLYER